MLSDQISVAVNAAPLAALDDIAKSVWSAVRAGSLSGEAAQTLAEQIQARRQNARQGTAFKTKRSVFPPKRKPPVYDRSQSILRRRSLAAMAPLPRAMVPHFTLSQLAVLRVILEQVATHGDCRLCVGAIAGKAGVSETTVRDTVRLAAHLALISVEQRPQFRKPNLPNVIRLVSLELREWLTHPRWKATGCKNSKATHSKSLSRTERANCRPEGQAEPEKNGFRDRTRSFPVHNPEPGRARLHPSE